MTGPPHLCKNCSHAGKIMKAFADKKPFTYCKVEKKWFEEGIKTCDDYE
jgi:hypothetical protein